MRDKPVILVRKDCSLYNRMLSLKLILQVESGCPPQYAQHEDTPPCEVQMLRWHLGESNEKALRPYGYFVLKQTT